MPVYVLCLQGEPSHVKIGYAANIDLRVLSLQTMSWRTIQILRIIDGGRDAETWLQDHFKQRHVAREWFMFDPDMLTVVPALKADSKITRIPHSSYANRRSPVEPEGFHADVIRRLGGTTKIAKAIGLTKSVLTKWPVRGIPSRHWLRIIEMGALSLPPVIITARELDCSRPGMNRAA